MIIEQDLKRFSKPSVIEALDYEEILSKMKNELIRLDPTFTALLESDPAIKILEVAAWRELLLRQRVNDAAKANLLAFASQSNLDHLAAFYGVLRQKSEEDEAFKNRIQAKIVGWSTAGSKEHYRYHALSADVRVRDALADSLKSGQVRISVLAKDGAPSQELLETVRKAILRDDIRMLTDTVEIISCGIIPVKIRAKIFLYPLAPQNLIETAKERFLKKLESSKGLGWSLAKTWIIAHLFTEGMQKIELIEPGEDIFVKNDECIVLEDCSIEKV